MNLLPPHSPEDEKAVIACCLLNAPEALQECLHISEASFYDLIHKLCWRAITELYRANLGVDQVSVSRKLVDMGYREVAFEYLPRLLDSVPSALNIGYYIPVLMDHEARRRVLAGCADMTQAAMGGATPEKLKENALKMVNFESCKDILTMDGMGAGCVMIDDLERRHGLGGKHSGLDTGLWELDNKLDGLQFGEQTLVGARPSKGKTALGLGIFQKLCLKDKVPSVFVSLEMSAQALMRRMLSSHSGMTMNEVRRGSYTEGDFNKINLFHQVARNSPMFIMDGINGLTVSQICQQLKRIIDRHKIKLVVVDYLQKIRADERHEKRTYEVAQVSGKLRDLAVDTGCAFLTLAQTNRESEREKGRPPRLSDLGDSGQIERDADTVILIHHSDAGAQLIIAKQRDGETGIVPVVFNGPFCRFESRPMPF